MMKWKLCFMMSLPLLSQPLGSSRNIPGVVRAEDRVWRDLPNAKGVQYAMLFGDLGRPGPYAVQFKLEKGTILPPHHHPNDEFGTVITGSFQTAMGCKLDTTDGVRLKAGSFAYVSKQMFHFAWTDEPTVVQVHGEGPWRLIPVDEHCVDIPPRSRGPSP